jgi:basic amino acid/polyamine antiporter, APA family
MISEAMPNGTNLNSKGQLLDYIVFAVLMFYILTIGGLFVLRFKRPDEPRPYRTFGYPILPALYILMAIFIDGVLLRYKPQFTWPGLIIVLLGVPVYFLFNGRMRGRMGGRISEGKTVSYKLL